MIRQRIMGWLGIVVLGIAVSVSSGWAISVSPPRTEISLPPGGKTTALITITNPDKEAYDVEITEKSWFVYPDNKKIQVPDWLKLPHKTHFRLKPGKDHQVEITLICPKEAIGELMGMVSVAYQTMTPGMITPMISTAVYLRALGTEKNTGDILALTPAASSGTFRVGAQIKATGNIRLVPLGSIQLLNEAGVLVSEYTVPEGQPLFPGQLRDYAARGSPAEPAAGHYTLSSRLKSGTLELKGEQGFLVKGNGDIQLDMKKETPKP